MKQLKSLSAKIIAAIFALVALAFIADTLLTRSINQGVYQRTEALTGQMRAIVEAKDTEIQSLLTNLLNSREGSQQLNQTLAASKLEAKGLHKEALLEGTRHGISMSVASLISSAMMSGDAASAVEQIDTLLENDQIAAINLWRTDGNMAFRDNKTIEAVNTFVEADIFEPRDPESAIIIPDNRKAILQQALGKNSNSLSLDATIKDDEDNTIPVTYSYFLLENKEDCQSCHDSENAIRGVVEVAVASDELLALRAQSSKQIAELEKRLDAERAQLVNESKAKQEEVAKQTTHYTSELNDANAELVKTREEASLMSVGSKLFFFLLTIILLVIALGRLLSQPLKRLTSAMLRLAENDLTVEATENHREDEIGSMSRAISIFKDNAVERQKLEKESEEHMQQQQERQELIDTLFADFRSKIQLSLQTVSARAQSMQSSAEALNDISSTTSERAHSVNDASTHSSENVQIVAAASTEMMASIGEIGEQVVRTNDLVVTVSEEAGQTDTEVASLVEAAEKIGEVVSLIREISEQTNLLALNATIEAARAGEAGRGFAVVAAEVKDLAAQTGKATEDIASRIQTIQTSTGTSVEAIRSIATKMNEIREYTSAISAAVTEQSAATNEISHNIQQAAEGTKEIVLNISDVANSTEETRSSAHEVQTAAITVASVATDMRTIIDEFLEKVAAA